MIYLRHMQCILCLSAIGNTVNNDNTTHVQSDSHSDTVCQCRWHCHWGCVSDSGHDSSASWLAAKHPTHMTYLLTNSVITQSQSIYTVRITNVNKFPVVTTHIIAHFWSAPLLYSSPQLCISRLQQLQIVDILDVMAVQLSSRFSFFSLYHWYATKPKAFQAKKKYIQFFFTYVRPGPPCAYFFIVTGKISLITYY